MKNGKYSKRRGVASKTLVLALAVMLIVGATIGGTIAWLTDKTDEVVNTFTTSDIDITLTETGTENNAKEYKMVPGYTLSKDPKVTVSADSEDCYLFVKVTETFKDITIGDNTYGFDDFISYTIAAGWVETSEGSGIYYKIIDAADKKNVAYSVLTDDQVSISENVTKEMMNAVGADNYPKLTFQAAAVQLYKNNTEEFSVTDALAMVQWPQG